MTIQQLDDTRVIIVLCKEDMETLSLKYSTLSFKDAHSRTVIKQLVSVAGHRAGFTLSNHSVAIEALPYNTGCLLVVTLLPKSRNPKRYRIKRDEKIVMFTFEDAENLLCCMHQLFIRKYKIYGCAYTYDNKYFFTVNAAKDAPAAAIHILREYAQKETTDKLSVSAVQEHASCIACKNAVELIGSALH